MLKIPWNHWKLPELLLTFLRRHDNFFKKNSVFLSTNKVKSFEKSKILKQVIKQYLSFTDKNETLELENGFKLINISMNDMSKFGKKN